MDAVRGCSRKRKNGEMWKRMHDMTRVYLSRKALKAERGTTNGVTWQIPYDNDSCCRAQRRRQPLTHRQNCQWLIPGLLQRALVCLDSRSRLLILSTRVSAAPLRVWPLLQSRPFLCCIDRAFGS